MAAPRDAASISAVPLVSVIVLGFNGRAYLERCLDSVLAQDYPRFEIIYVDNASHDGSAQLVADRYATIRRIENQRNLGYAGGNNIGIDHARGDILFLVNQDVELEPDCLSALASALACDPRVGIAGCKIFDSDGITLQHAGGVLGPSGLSEHIGRGERDIGQYASVAEREYVTGAAIAIRRSVWTACGPLDPAYFPAYYEETDLCVSARSRGFRVIFVPNARLIHHEAASTGKTSPAHNFAYHRNRVRFVLKTYPPGRILRQSIPYEISWILHSMPPSHARPLIAAYVRGLLALPWLTTRRLRQRLHRRRT